MQNVKFWHKKQQSDFRGFWNGPGAIPKTMDKNATKMWQKKFVQI